MRTMTLRVASLALLLLLSLAAVLTVRTLGRLPDTKLYLVAAHAGSFGLEPVPRRIRAEDPEARARALVRALAAGPTEEERARGLASEVPPGLEVRSAELTGGVLELDLSADLERGGGSATMQARLYQLLYTLTQPGDVEAVALRLEGRPLRVLGGEGLLVAQPWRREAEPGRVRW